MANGVGELECGRCQHRFSEHDVCCYRFFPDNHLCYKCCKELQRADHKVSCFGKLTVGKRLGYERSAIECKELCPDRRVCVMFAEGSVVKMRELTQEARQKALRFLLAKDRHGKPPSRVAFRAGSGLAKAFEFLKRGCSRKELTKFCEDSKIDRPWLLRIMRREEANGHEWKWVESADRLQVIYPRKG